MASSAKKSTKTRKRPARITAVAKKKAAAKSTRKAPVTKKADEKPPVNRTTAEAKSAISDAIKELSEPKEKESAPEVLRASETEITIERKAPEPRATAPRRSPVQKNISAEKAVAAPGRRRLRDRDVISFLRQLIMLLEAGTPMLKSLKSLETRGETPAVRQMVANITNYVEAGNPLWQAFARESFSPVDVNLIKASEASGTLTTVLRRIVEYRERRSLMKKRVQTAMIYPVVLLTVGFAVLVVIATVVIPPFVDIFDSMDVEISGYTKFVMGVFGFIAAWWWLLALVVVGLVLFYVLIWSRNPIWRATSDRIKIRLPIVGNIARKNAVAEFCRTFSLMLRSGLSMMVTLDLCRNSMGNRAYADTIQDMRDSVERGEGFEKPLRNAERKGLFAGVVVDMLITGEETGTVDDISEQIADTYEEEIKIQLETIGEALLPIVVVTLGAFAICVALALFSPIVQLINAVAAGNI
jgi:type II secretory pathway component PulF